MKPIDLEKTIKEHVEHDRIFQEKIDRVLFGDPATGSKGMMDKVDDMHNILTSTRNILGFFGGVGGFLKWLIIIGAVVGVIKGWWASIIHSIIHP